jgi:hypothetical protein
LVIFDFTITQRSTQYRIKIIREAQTTYPSFNFPINCTFKRVTVGNDYNRTKNVIDVVTQCLSENDVDGFQITFGQQQPVHVNRYRLYVNIIDNNGIALGCII